MLTLKLKNKSVSNIKLLKEYLFQSTGLFMKLYNNFELSQDKTFRADYCSKKQFVASQLFKQE